MEAVKKLLEKEIRSAGIAGGADLGVPPKPEMGDFALACFDLARANKTNPAEAAKNIARLVKPGRLIEKAEAAGPYVNFFLKPAAVAETVLLGKPRKNPKGKKIMVEYSQPNTHKEFHVGHLRNACIGGAVVEILRRAGNKVIAANYIGDIGAHVAKCLWYIKKYKMNEWPEKNLGSWVGRMYTESVLELEKFPDLKKEVDDVQRKLEAREGQWMKLWKLTRQASLSEFKKIYKLLGNNFDVWFFESEEEKRGKEIVAGLLKKGIAKKGEGGAVIVDLSGYGLDIFMLLKSDGSSLYATKDLALAEKKFKKYKVDESVVIIDTRQSFYFKQLFKTLELSGWKKELVCMPYEFVRLPEGAMSSRRGNVVLFETIFKEVFDYLKNETAVRHAGWAETKTQKTAELIALAAVKFAMLKHPINKVIEFDVKEAVSIDGFTGPYILYTVARVNSIIKKYGRKIPPAKTVTEFFSSPEEKHLLLKLSAFDTVAAEAAESLDPSVLAKYAFDLAKTFNDFYNKCSVLKAESKGEKKARIVLSSVSAKTLTVCLKLLNIQTVREM